MKVSNRMLDMNFSEIRKLSIFATEAENRGINVYHLNIGQPDIKTPKEFMEGVLKFKEDTLKYTNSQGINILLNGMIDYYARINIKLDKSEVYITNGASEGLQFALMVTCDFGDEILIPEPYYTNYDNIAKICGVKIVPINTKREEGFHIKNKNDILNKITSKTKAILLSNPGNPTGVVYTKDEIRMIGDVAKEKNIFIISDEAYREFIYDNLEYTSFMHLEDILDRVVLIDSMSKRYSACGARIGAIACKNKEILRELLKLCQTRLSVSTLDQLGGASLTKIPNEYFKKINKEYESRRNLLYEELNKIEGVKCNKPSGAFYILAKLPVKDSTDFAKWLLTDFNIKNETIIITPAKGFYSSDNLGKNEIRLSYCINEKQIKKSMKILREGLKKYNNYS